MQLLSASNLADCGTVFQGTQLRLTVWFLAIYLTSQARPGLDFRCWHSNALWE